jgi:D-alanyl-D-alanine dipeptidase
MPRLLVLACLLFAPDLFAQQGPPKDPAATRRAYLIELREVMAAEGFTVEPNELWHYNYKDWREYPILDIPFSAIGK